MVNKAAVRGDTELHETVQLEGKEPSDNSFLKIWKRRVN